MYQNSFYITEPVGNNALSFAERPSPPRLYVPALIEGDLNAVQLGDEVVFEDVDENGKLQSCKGLKNLVRFLHPVTRKPVVVVDNHNHVFYFWYEACAREQIKRGATLVHIDQHADTRHPETFLNSESARDLNKVFDYTNFTLNVGNYIPPAMHEGLVGDLVSITSESALRAHVPQAHASSLIVNIDLDFWAPEMNYIDHTLSIARTREWMRHADLITICTSPFFIDQPLALAVLHELFESGL